ncbi:MAG TPA: ferredoxin [Candidatus Nealsonbacteria bacterium]|uniref:4Fe-4S ferredoxin-type domain-containing protein n=1 Tax=marine sediment metagenome TaxID=412755 RepID=A0A0F9X3Z6_9ZZZZ|nr:ferredoxin [Candidatus Nealsonbacteria bacterium]HEB46380.1 ferredoxin [Candidatus Nealsonbacteria bacterium]
MTKIIQEREKCIGCGSCVVLCPKFWEMDEDGKSNLKEGRKNSEGNYELEVEEIECNQEAADSCPVQIIHIIKK